MRAWEGAEARCPWSESRQQAAIGPEGKRGSKCIWRHGRAGPWGTGRERGGFQGQHRDVRPPGAVLGHERAGAVGAHQGEACRLRQHHLHVRSPPASMVRRLSQRPSSFSAPSARPPGCDESAIGAVYWKNPAAPEVGARAKCTCASDPPPQQQSLPRTHSFQCAALWLVHTTADQSSPFNSDVIKVIRPHMSGAF